MTKKRDFGYRRRPLPSRKEIKNQLVLRGHITCNEYVSCAGLDLRNLAQRIFNRSVNDDFTQTKSNKIISLTEEYIKNIDEIMER